MNSDIEVRRHTKVPPSAHRAQPSNGSLDVDVVRVEDFSEQPGIRQRWQLCAIVLLLCFSLGELIARITQSSRTTPEDGYEALTAFGSVVSYACNLAAGTVQSSPIRPAIAKVQAAVIAAFISMCGMTAFAVIRMVSAVQQLQGKQDLQKEAYLVGVGVLGVIVNVAAIALLLLLPPRQGHMPSSEGLRDVHGDGVEIALPQSSLAAQELNASSAVIHSTGSLVHSAVLLTSGILAYTEGLRDAQPIYAAASIFASALSIMLSVIIWYDLARLVLHEDCDGLSCCSCPMTAAEQEINYHPIGRGGWMM